MMIIKTVLAALAAAVCVSAVIKVDPSVKPIAQVGGFQKKGGGRS